MSRSRELRDGEPRRPNAFGTSRLSSTRSALWLGHIRATLVPPRLFFGYNRQAVLLNLAPFGHIRPTLRVGVCSHLCSKLLPPSLPCSAFGQRSARLGSARPRSRKGAHGARPAGRTPEYGASVGVREAAGAGTARQRRAGGVRPRARRRPAPLPFPAASLPPCLPGAGAQHSACRGGATEGWVDRRVWGTSEPRLVRQEREAIRLQGPRNLQVSNRATKGMN